MGVLNTEILKEILFAVSDDEKDVEKFLLAGKEMLQTRYLNRVKEIKIHPNRNFFFVSTFAYSKNAFVSASGTIRLRTEDFDLSAWAGIVYVVPSESVLNQGEKTN